MLLTTAHLARPGAAPVLEADVELQEADKVPETEMSGAQQKKGYTVISTESVTPEMDEVPLSDRRRPDSYTPI